MTDDDERYLRRVVLQRWILAVVLGCVLGVGGLAWALSAESTKNEHASKVEALNKKISAANTVAEQAKKLMHVIDTVSRNQCAAAQAQKTIRSFKVP